MRGDETQSALAKEGPRHAAPRRSLLNRIQGPAGKAMALAAMPTAVFVGMGLTPKLALADEKDIPFAPGPCVTRSDEPVQEETTKPAETAKPKPSDTPTATPSATAPTATAAPTATGSPTPTATETGQATTEQTGDRAKATAAPTATPTATPTPTTSKNPLDPLGLGDALKDLFDGPDPKPSETPTTAAPTTQAPTPSASTTPPADKPDTADEPAATTAPKPADSPKPADDPAEKTKRQIEQAAEKAGAEVEELPEGAKGLDAKKDEDIPDGAKPHIPCAVPDPEALAAAELEPGIPLLPDEPWRLDSTKLTLEGLHYHGIVEVRTGSGKTKKALKFTASKVKIKDLHQTTVHSDGRSAHVRSTPGKESTITEGTVTMYTESLKGNLFGLFPVTFSPATPPPLDVPLAIFTDVTVMQAGQFGGTLRVPGLRNTIEPS
ncbi:hypothetical protein [Streptomyces sp. NPDC096351]|uniref:hypothetical protein n=1 Tax=Streptomyces sp. NPDC096351 TaxID=3366087 RepID=UPI0037FC90D6